MGLRQGWLRCKDKPLTPYKFKTAGCKHQQLIRQVGNDGYYRGQETELGQIRSSWLKNVEYGFSQNQEIFGKLNFEPHFGPFIEYTDLLHI